MSKSDIIAINPNTRTAPVFRSQTDADLTRQIYARVPVLDTEHLFGVTEGSDIGEAGERELESDTTFRSGKNSGAFNTTASEVEFKYTAFENFRISAAAMLAYYDIGGVADMDDRRQGSLQWARRCTRPRRSRADRPRTRGCATNGYIYRSFEIRLFLADPTAAPSADQPNAVVRGPCACYRHLLVLGPPVVPNR
jgi:hypothetical protein